MDIKKREVTQICDKIYFGQKYKNRTKQILHQHLKDPNSRKKILEDCRTIKNDKNAKITPIDVDAFTVRKYVRRRFQNEKEIEKISGSPNGLVWTLFNEVKGLTSFYNESKLPNLVRICCTRARLEMIIRCELKKRGITSFDELLAHQSARDDLCRNVKRSTKSENINDRQFNHAFNEVLIQMLRETQSKVILFAFPVIVVYCT